jgi:polysaccharide biosynthesis/export protein
MNIKKIYSLFFISIFLASCVPSKDLIYLQKKNFNNNDAVQQVAVKPYRLQVSDVLSISIAAIDSKLVQIFNTDTQTNQLVNEQTLYYKGYSVDDHGEIRMPILGKINVLGYTTDEVRQKIEKQLLQDHFKQEAGIFVTVKLAGFRYTINGEINNPGTKVLSQEKVSILEAIANAGDISVVGDRKDVVIVRQFAHGVETFSIDLTDYKALQSPYFYLQPNDYVYVKPLKQKTWGTGKTGIESLSSIITILSLVTTTYLLLKN